VAVEGSDVVMSELSAGRDGSEADLIVAEVSRHVGALEADEAALVFGTATAQQYASLDHGVSSVEVMALSQVIGAFRTAPCRFCHLGLVDHAVDLSPQGPQVWCTIDQSARPLSAWLPTSTTASPGGGVAATLLWVGIPLVSLGMLSWAMPAVAAVLHRRMSWALAAAVFLALTVTMFLVMPEDVNTVDPVGDAILFGTWLAGSGYGALQIKPWLVAQSAPGR
jgi:hypothetical protein